MHQFRSVHDLIRQASAWIVVTFSSLLVVESAWSQLNLDIVVMTGQPVQGGSGAITDLRPPPLNDAGQFAFLAGVSGSGGIVLGDDSGGLELLVRAGDALPDGSGSITSFPTGFVTLNNAGQVAFTAEVAEPGSAGASFSVGVFRSDAENGVVTIARADDAALNGSGNFSGFAGEVTLNDLGEVGIAGIFRAAGLQDEIGLFSGDGTDTPRQIVRPGVPSPDGVGVLVPSVFRAFNDLGQVAFPALSANANGQFAGLEGIFRGDGLSDVMAVARTGDTAPDGISGLSGFSGAALNNTGEVAFRAFLGTNGVPSGVGLFRGDGERGLTPIVRSGDPAPDGNGSFSTFFSPNLLNDAGQVAFLGLVGETNSGFSENGVFLGDGVNDLVQIARAGEVTPDGSRVISFPFDPVLNDAGQVAFIASLIDPSDEFSDDSGLFFYDDQFGLLQVLRTGESFLGSTVTSVGFADGFGNETTGQELSGLNNFGQLAFSFSLADGRRGIAIAAVIPEPGGGVATVLCAALLMRRRS